MAQQELRKPILGGGILKPQGHHLSLTKRHSKKCKLKIPLSPESICQLPSTVCNPIIMDDPKPAVKISESHRRSLHLSKCMMKESMFYRPMGRDKYGFLTYALVMSESQGFKWSKNLHNLSVTTTDPQMLASPGFYYSDCDDNERDTDDLIFDVANVDS